MIPNTLFTALYIIYRLLPILMLHLKNLNPHHNFGLTSVAEFFMLLDDIGLISYHTSKILGGTVFGIEKLLGYSTYTTLTKWTTYPPVFLLSYMFRYLYPETESVNILYMIVVLLWFWKITKKGSWYQILGALIYTITDYDVAFYDSQNFGVMLLPTYQLGLLLLSQN